MCNVSEVVCAQWFFHVKRNRTALCQTSRFEGAYDCLYGAWKATPAEGWPTIALETYTLDIGIEPTAEEEEVIRAALEVANKQPFVYDPEYPPLTKEQLAEFHPVNGMTWEERVRLMRERGLD
jgi:hypothetical protein